MADGRQARYEVGRDLLGPALGTGRANPGLAAVRNGQLDIASTAREASDPKIWVPTQQETPESLFGIRLQRPVSVNEPAVIGRDKRLQVVYEDAPKGAEKCVALAILTPASWWGRGGKSKRHQT